MSKKMILHRNTKCFQCHKMLSSGTEATGYFSTYLNRLIVFCCDCEKHRQEERRTREQEKQRYQTVKGRRLQNIMDDKMQTKLVGFLQ